MRVIVIDAVTRTIEHRELADTNAIVHFFPNGISYCNPLDTGDMVYIDDLAMDTPAEHFFVVPGNSRPLPTTGLIVGPDADDGKSTLDVRVSIDELRASINGWTGALSRHGPMIRAEVQLYQPEERL